jgi:replicative DNA helicase
MAADITPIDRGRPRDRRVLPHNLDLEASILGGVLLQPTALEDLPLLETDDFFDPKHKIVFDAIRNVAAAQRPIDVVTVEAEIERRGKLEAIGGLAFLGELTLRVPTVDNVVSYADQVRRLAANRRAILKLGEALERAWTWQHEPGELIGETIGELGRIEERTQPRKSKLISIEQAYDELDMIARAPVYPTPFETINDALGFGGFLGTQVYTVAAGTGRGKTTWVASVGAFSAQTVPVLVASYEMRPGYFVARKAAGVLGVHSNEIMRGRVDRDQVLRAMPYPRLKLMHKPTLRELRDAVDEVADAYGEAPLVIVDYIQKLADEIALQQTRPDLRIATSQASATLLDIADRSRCAMLAVSAIGRGKSFLKNPRKHHPHDLVEVAKESGAVEYDGAALIVLSLSDDFEDEERIGTMTVAKARFGREIHVDARYNGARGMWRDVGEIDGDDSKPTTRADAASSPRPEREDNEDRVRAKIIAELHKAPAPNKTALKLRITGCRKEVVGQLIQRMRDEGVIAVIAGHLTLSPAGRQLVLEVPS